ncbi:unnamed protein product, partial [Heterotrigona itama]
QNLLNRYDRIWHENGNGASMSRNRVTEKIHWMLGLLYLVR